MTIQELKIDFINESLKDLKQTPNYNKFIKLIEKVEINHLNVHTEESRDLFRIVLKEFIQTYIDSMYIMPDFVKICFKYVAMFKNSQQIILYLEKHKLDESVEYWKQLILFCHYSLKDDQQTEYNINRAQQKFPQNKKLQEIISIVRNSQVQGSRYTHQTAQEQGLLNKMQLTFLSPDEIRLGDMTEMKIKQHKKDLANDSINIKPYQLMGYDKYTIFQMMQLLNPRNDVTVYYELHNQLHRTWITNIPIRNEEEYQISYLEYINLLPMFQSQNIDKLVGQKISFTSQISFQTIKLNKMLGQGGFGAVFSGKMYKNKKVYDVAIKIFTREKDNVQLNQISVSGSFLRELYALACITDRFRKLEQTGLLNNQFYFTKLYCGLLSLQGNGIIIMEYVNGKNMYQISKENKLNKIQILQYLKQMIKLVQVLHRLDVIHSDLKIDNFILQNQQLYICDFGKSVDLKLFLQDNKQHLYLNYKNLNSVSPSINCDPIYLFNCDYAGLAHCLYTMQTQKILSNDDIKVYRDKQNFKCVVCDKMKAYDQQINYLFEQLINYRCQGDYRTAKLASDQKLQQLITYIDSQL